MEAGAEYIGSFSDHRFFGISGDLGEGSVYGMDHALGISDHHGIGCGLDNIRRKLQLVAEKYPQNKYQAGQRGFGQGHKADCVVARPPKQQGKQQWRKKPPRPPAAETIPLAMPPCLEK